MAILFLRNFYFYFLFLKYLRRYLKKKRFEPHEYSVDIFLDTHLT